MTKKSQHSLEAGIRQDPEDFSQTTPARLVQKPALVARKVTSVTPQATTRYITLNEWAASQFSRVPHYNTLIRWVHDGRIQPQPVKIGRNWWVKPEAEHIGDD